MEPGKTEKLQKLLAQAGLGSRRDMETWIEAGRVEVNGKPATLGTRVGPEDLVKVDRRIVRLQFTPPQPQILLYHKPEGEIVSREDPGGRATVFDRLPRIRGGKWIAIGRLDVNTSGLLIFTTSGELANHLMHPRFEVEREYAVRVRGELADAQMKQLTTGVELEDGKAHFDFISDEGGEHANHWYRVILREGRNREVRRMFDAIGFTVSRLMRVRFGPVNMPARLKRGQVLPLEDAQVRQVLKWAGLADHFGPPAQTRPGARPLKARRAAPAGRHPAPETPAAERRGSRAMPGRTGRAAPPAPADARRPAAGRPAPAAPGGKTRTAGSRSPATPRSRRPRG